MRDLGVLKERIEFAERHLQAAHAARERESEAHMAMWRQIRDRSEAQEAEIKRYRSELSDMTRANDELSALVDRLIASVEGSARASASETAREVAHMAHDLLKWEPARRTPAPRAAAAAAPPRAEARAPDRPTAPEPEPAPARTSRAAIEEALAALETDDPLDLGIPIDEPAPQETRSSFSRLLDEQLSHEEEASVEDEADDDDTGRDAERRDDSDAGHRHVMEIGIVGGAGAAPQQVGQGIPQPATGEQALPVVVTRSRVRRLFLSAARRIVLLSHRIPPESVRSDPSGKGWNKNRASWRRPPHH